MSSSACYKCNRTGHFARECSQGGGGGGDRGGSFGGPRRGAGGDRGGGGGFGGPRGGGGGGGGGFGRGESSRHEGPDMLHAYKSHSLLLFCFLN